jgi:hypothetical protein
LPGGAGGVLEGPTLLVRRMLVVLGSCCGREGVMSRFTPRTLPKHLIAPDKKDCCICELLADLEVLTSDLNLSAALGTLSMKSS